MVPCCQEAEPSRTQRTGGQEAFLFQPHHKVEAGVEAEFAEDVAQLIVHDVVPGRRNLPVIGHPPDSLRHTIRDWLGNRTHTHTNSKQGTDAPANMSKTSRSRSACHSDTYFTMANRWKAARNMAAICSDQEPNPNLVTNLGPTLTPGRFQKVDPLGYVGLGRFQIRWGGSNCLGGFQIC